MFILWYWLILLWIWRDGVLHHLSKMPWWSNECSLHWTIVLRTKWITAVWEEMKATTTIVERRLFWDMIAGVDSRGVQMMCYGETVLSGKRITDSLLWVGQSCLPPNRMPRKGFCGFGRKTTSLYKCVASFQMTLEAGDVHIPLELSRPGASNRVKTLLAETDLFVVRLIDYKVRNGNLENKVSE